MRSPYRTLFPGDLTLPLRLFGALAVVSGGVLLMLDGALKTEAAPLGIASFELAWDRASAEAMMASWEASPPAMIHAALSLGVDYLFMFAYALAFGMLTLRWIAPLETSHPKIHGIGVGLSWGWLGAGALDAVENMGLASLLLGGGGAWAAPLSFICASAKFAIVFAGLSFLPVVGLARRR